MKMVSLVKGQDGKTCFRETVAINPKARLACTVLSATITSDVFKAAMSDDGPSRINPRKLVSIACDVANAMYDEIEEREWIMEYPLSEGDTVLGSF